MHTTLTTLFQQHLENQAHVSFFVTYRNQRWWPKCSFQAFIWMTRGIFDFRFLFCLTLLPTPANNSSVQVNHSFLIFQWYFLFSVSTWRTCHVPGHCTGLVDSQVKLICEWTHCNHSRDVWILNSSKHSHKLDSLVSSNLLSFFCALIQFFHNRILCLWNKRENFSPSQPKKPQLK